MDSFEQLVSELLWAEGYWVQTSVKVELTKEEKKRIGRPTTPRWELDVVAYKGRKNELLVMECKSFLDSRGVQPKDVIGCTASPRYKLFIEPKLRSVVLGRLCEQMREQGLVRKGVKARLGLAAGKISDRGSDELQVHFLNQGWELWTPEVLVEKLRRLSNGGYENRISSVVSKLLGRTRFPQ